MDTVYWKTAGLSNVKGKPNRAIGALVLDTGWPLPSTLCMNLGQAKPVSGRFLILRVISRIARKRNGLAVRISGDQALGE